ncbi:PadR family transcriptional regulator [Limnospira sp. PMC 1042.18]|uniref:PadR family transcriptional regulator n=1 Tax=Limnospira sp. PMC 1042.18 TaxID=2981018 RepID=UPI0028E12FC2|nr:PadR family transcriptional regulator [Limnospira sp. PMC 1042.18]MDT9196723.1 PadR family transcriptional regulator [Limnospira sp. PMC 1042.18]
MLELSALGLLQREPLHGYRLKQRLELFMGSCISVNYGAIYPLLKRLEERGYIQVILEEAGDAGSSRKVYGITAAGRERWLYKMLEQPQESWVKSRSRFLIKYFFFSDLNLQNRLLLLEYRLTACQQRMAYLREKEVEYVPIDSYQSDIWKRAKFLLESEVKWLSKTYDNLQQEIEGVDSLSEDR